MKNLMSCQGFNSPGFMGDCSLAWLGIAILVFIVLIERKQIGENMGTGYNTLAGFIGALLPTIILISIGLANKWAILVGVLGSLLGGIGVGQYYDSTEET